MHCTHAISLDQCLTSLTHIFCEMPAAVTAAHDYQTYTVLSQPFLISFAITVSTALSRTVSAECSWYLFVQVSANFNAFLQAPRCVEKALANFVCYRPA